MSTEGTKGETLSGQTAVAVDRFAGRVLSHYRIEERLGAGGMGVLYRATDLKLGRAVAIKLLARHLVSDESAKARFVREARAASALDHPNIANIHDIGEENGELFIVMALYEGETLRQRLQKGRLGLDEALALLRQVALGLEAAHRAGIVHRDIKPPNILMTTGGTAKILDFGVAKLLSESQAQMTQAGQAIGTVLYMSPEQLNGERVDARSDLWSLGVLAYEALAGVSPFQSDSSAATMKRILSDEPPSLATVPGVPSWLSDLVLQLLRKNLAERPQSASELLKRLDKPVLSSPAMTNTFRSRGVRGATPAALIAVTIALGVGGLYLYQQRGSANQVKSLIVLPFANASGNADVEYLSDGITEGLINSLSQLHELQVIARATAFRYKGKEVDFQKLGRDLSVDAVLTGRVQQLSDSLLIQADLVKISTGSQLWGERYERKLVGLSGVQQEITRSISEKLWPRLSAEEQRRVSKHETASSEAYQFYLRGRHLYNKRTRETMEKSVEYFHQAIDLDPQYAVAYATLSQVYGSLAYRQYWRQEDALPKAEAAAQKALALDEEIADAHVSQAFIKFQKWDWSNVESELKRAIELSPNHAGVRQLYGHYLAVMGRDDNALAEFVRAQQLDPATAFVVANAGWMFCRVGRYDRGIALLRDSLELEPDAGESHYILATACYARQQMYSKAIEEARRAVALGSSSPMYQGALGYLYARSGSKSEALAILEKLKQWDKDADSTISIAQIYVGLNENDEALTWLEKAYQRHTNRAIWLKSLGIFGEFQPLQSDPRFANLLRRMGFPE